MAKYKIIKNDTGETVEIIEASMIDVRDGSFFLYQDVDVCNHVLVGSFTRLHFSFYEVKEKSKRIELSDILDEDVIDFINKMKA